MRREEALAIMRREKVRLMEQYGLTAIGIFGSTARDEAEPDSDVDVYVRLPSPNIHNLLRLQEELARTFGSEVDLVHEHKYLRPRFRERILREGVFV